MRWVVAMVLLAPGCVRAEFVRIEQELTKLDCASCADSLAARMKRLRGVETAALVGSRAIRLDLAPRNAIRLETVRDLAKGVGITPGAATVRVRGTATESQGLWHLVVSGLDQSYRLNLGSGVHAPQRGAPVVVDGTVPAPARPDSEPVLDATAVEAEP